MGRRGPTTPEQKSKQLDLFLIDIALCGALEKQADDERPGSVSFRNHSARQIQDNYGKDCADLFKLLYTRWTRGGCTLEGKPFKTQWRLVPGAAKELLKLIQTRTEQTTAKQWVERLRELGFCETFRDRMWDDRGNLIATDIHTTEEHAEVVRLKSELRKLFKTQKQRREALWHI